MQDCSISSALEMGILRFCAKPSICTCMRTLLWHHPQRSWCLSVVALFVYLICCFLFPGYCLLFNQLANVYVSLLLQSKMAITHQDILNPILQNLLSCYSSLSCLSQVCNIAFDKSLWNKAHYSQSSWICIGPIVITQRKETKYFISCGSHARPCLS